MGEGYWEGWANGRVVLGECRENWQSGPENEERGKKWLDTIYKHNRTKTMEPMMAHRDFGMFLSLPFYTLFFPPFIFSFQ